MPRSSSLGHPGSSGIVPACVGNGTSALYAVDHPPHRITPASMGNTASPTKLETVCSGSSPRAWGTPLHTMQVQRFYGIIPACVGNTKGGSMSPCKDRDHPRVRGEHRCIQNCPRDDKGSSPRAWGTPQVKGLIDLALRIIPTCVGNTPAIRYRPNDPEDHPHVRGEHTASIPSFSRSCQDHPHVRGEHYHNRTVVARVLGSSPRAWGTQPHHMDMP